MLHFQKLDGSTPKQIPAHENIIYDIAWNLSGDRLASASRDHWLRFWTIDGQKAGEFNTGQTLTSVSWKPDGTQLATGCDDGTIVIRVPDGTPIRVIKGHDNRVTTVRWSSDGKRIASGGRDGTVRLWSEKGSRQAILRGHTGTSRHVDWRPHSTQLLSGGYDATVRLWDTETHRPLWVLVILGDKQSVKFSPEGHMLAGDTSVFSREFRYILEQPNGAMEIVTPQEFQTRTQQGVTTQTK
jgi:WD40 repeat protein